ncbi:MAG: NAD-dependent epimerase/dehydratase family protein [Bacteroidota bacterium]
MKRVLFLGGSQFMGRMLVEQLIESNQYDLTLFNRGKTNRNLFPDVQRLIGDRETDDIEQVFGTDWDIVVDFSAYHPNSFERLVNGLKGRVGRYVFISTVSAYEVIPGVLKDEQAPTLACTEEQRNDPKVTAENYGSKKAEMERFLFAQDDLDSITLRPCLVYGPYDHTDRFYYWMYRVFTQDRFLLPETSADKMNLTYVKDMVNICRKAMEIEQHRKVYNTTTHDPNTLEDKVAVIQEVLQKSNEWIRVPGSEIMEKLGPLAAWTGDDSYCFDHSHVVGDFGMEFMSFEDSIHDYYKYLNLQGNWQEGNYGPRVSDEQAWIMEMLSK